MGALFFYHVAEVTVTPKNPPIVIRPSGGTFRFEATITNITDMAVRVNVWTVANVPETGHYGPLIKKTLNLSPHQSFRHPNVSQEVPGFAPAGSYSYIAFVGDFPSEKMDSSSFPFFKTGKGTGGKWSVDNWLEEIPGPNLPRAASLLANYPNPFNASTVISYELPVSCQVRLEVYNLFGEKVASLIDAQQEAGYRSVTWEDSEAASGVYFYKLTAGDFTEVKRMTLLR